MVLSAQRKTIARGLAEGCVAAIHDEPFAHTQEPPLMTTTHGHIPGYQGYICRSQHLHGKTFGNITRQAALALPHDHTDASPSTKKQLRMLSTLTTEMLHGEDTIILGQPRRTYEYTPCDNERRESRVITGYSGFIRGSQHYFGTSFPDIAKIAQDHQYDKADADPVALPADRLPGYAGVRPCAPAQAM